MDKPIKYDEACVHCHTFRATQRYRGIQLCISGPNCWRSRKRIFAVLNHARKQKEARGR